MSQFNITPSELQGMISRLQQWSNQMESIRTNMQAYASQLQQSWRDPQYDMYVQKVAEIGRTMKNSAEDLSHTAKVLTVLMRNLERTRADYRGMQR